MTGWLNRVQVGLVNHPPPSLFQIFTATLNLVLNCSQSRDTSTVKKRMEYKPAPIGVEVCGIDLKQPVPDSVIAQIREDVHKHRMLIFKDQGVVSADRHVEISKWFGELESTFYKHPKSPHPDVFRVSNDEEEGCTNVGRTGWHIDGSFMEQPFSFALYHMVSVPKIGNTAFVPLKELLESMSAERREQWERLWRTDHHYRHIQPLVYPHPVTKQPTICFHLGMTGGFVWDYGTDKERSTDRRETAQILQEMYREITKDNNRLVYSHKWEVGDFIISDNLAVGHEATPDTQRHVSEVGLRVLHRTTVRGKSTPMKGAYA
ncbi:(3R)-3-[(carboxymethyl)amino]fatty acid oxygenase/decarboxylase-like isoform X1 [Babylonia areolata]|uniref:(3R)-3-[(carboxymethyl)amino]fatty acid oxygenase/decarboxylase-like isoform X1 n=1 Tax=Babylonia areolata TaxID=304850 RepID=UPI003FD02217